MVVSYIGYDSQTKTIELYQNITQNFNISASPDNLDEVVLETNAERVNIKSPQMSVNALTANSIKQIPVVFGEADVIKAITLLPGVSNGGEGSGGSQCPWGLTDQNLILLDEATLFNSSHLFGFFSVFNPDAIKNIKLYKGGTLQNMADVWLQFWIFTKKKATKMNFMATVVLVWSPVGYCWKGH